MEESTEASSQAPQAGDAANLQKIKALLKAKDDTQRFVGLALLKSVLDNSPGLREDQGEVQSLWSSISPKFLDRLLKTGSTPSNKDAKDMLDLAVSVLHTFSLLLPESSRDDSRFTDRIPLLVAAALHSREQTTTLLLQVLNTLASLQHGAEALVRVDDLSPLTEMASSNSLALDVLYYAWLNAMEGSISRETLATTVDKTLKILVPSFSGTDAVTLLEFLGNFLRQADKAILPPSPPWLKTAVAYIKALVISRPTPEARAAYTNAAASLLQAYSEDATKLLFTDASTDDKPFGYLFINLLLIDIRSSIPMLLEQLNSPEYQKISRRLASAFDVIAIFVGFLVRSLDDDGPMVMQADSLLKLRKAISETMSVTIEYLRDRWDASFAGAMGLHPEARVSTAETEMGSRQTLHWDSMTNTADEDPLTLSALRALSLWLREEDNDTLLKEATGLTDMLMELYQSSSPERIDFRPAALVALEALVMIEKGREMLIKQEGWKILSRDLASTLQEFSRLGPDDARRGIDIVRVLISIAEQERTGTAEEWMDLITVVAAWDVSEQPQDPLMREFELAVLQLCSTVLERANEGMKRRYRLSKSAIYGLASRLAETIDQDDVLREQMDDVLAALRSINY